MGLMIRHRKESGPVTNGFQIAGYSDYIALRNSYDETNRPTLCYRGSLLVNKILISLVQRMVLFRQCQHDLFHTIHGKIYLRQIYRCYDRLPNPVLVFDLFGSKLAQCLSPNAAKHIQQRTS